jgi:small-conductance mechanosensitive channel
MPVRRDVWIFLFVLGALFFNWPLMSIFENSLVFSLFILWLVFIALIFITSFFSEREDGGG